MREFKLLRGYGYLGEITLPMITRVVAPRLITQDLVPVQPMRQPRGLLFYNDYRYNGEEIEQTIRHARI